MSNNADYRWPAYMSDALRRDLKKYLAEQDLTFSEWVRQHARKDIARRKGKVSPSCDRRSGRV